MSRQKKGFSDLENKTTEITQSEKLNFNSIQTLCCYISLPLPSYIVIVTDYTLNTACPLTHYCLMHLPFKTQKTKKEVTYHTKSTINWLPLLVFIFLMAANDFLMSFHFSLKDFFNVSCIAGPLVTNSPSSCLSGNILISPSLLKNTIAEYRTLC